ncbi:Mitogen-activated protein kinase-binding protein 1 [Morus notabilis]|uniref:Mitogen-activated protein kinase-binding protein 1 n=1 Tax=Morus notabilis TaxID=981085 RepID=W9SBN5_9ROSA|nr:Mitogen-activated protein kinase-binding protein 1 [Morus notabilis]
MSFDDEFQWIGFERFVIEMCLCRRVRPGGLRCGFRRPIAPHGFSSNAEIELKPAVLVWDVETLALVSELKGHLFGVGCIAFSPYGRHLVSVGGYIHLWEWRIGMLVTKLKASASCSAISSVSFSLDAKFVITAGKKHLMFWTFRSSPKTRISKGNVSMTMHGKAVNLGLQKGRSFISVTSSLRTDKTTMCGQAGEFFPLYALTDAG